MLVLGACYSEEPGVEYGGSAYVGGPQMEVVSPGVQVVADYDYPVFYSDGFYWRYDGGLWYRSGYYNGGWAVSYNVPYGVRGIGHPEYYAHYRGGYNNGYRGYNNGYRGGYRPNASWGARGNASGGVRTYNNRPAAVYRGGGGGYRGGGGSRGAVVRDHRR
ncbi:MAG TPA: hypothetical protein VIV58_01165 [Kofleriaceae bacterium]